MIRIIATDLDGTLLDQAGDMPGGVFELVEELARRGVRFAAASGRPYGNVRKLFSPVADQMDFICENGALVVAQGQTRADYFPRALSEEIIHDILSAGMELHISVPERNYTLTGASRAYLDEVVRHLGFEALMIDDPMAYADQYIKISGFCADGVEKLAPALQKKWQRRLHCDIAGHYWLDFTRMSKGDGIRILADTLHVPLSDVAAFGDQFNDESMLRVVGRPYIMAHAPAPLLGMGFIPCENVIDTIRAILLAKSA